MNRGSAVRVVVQVENGVGFNEAPIHESGKSPPTSPELPCWRCFNEAPIHESGKWSWRCVTPARSTPLQ